MTSPDDIDRLLAAAKTLAGTPAWIADERGTVARLAAPLAIGGVVGDLALQASAMLHTPVQRGSCVLICEGRPIQRLSIKLDHPHVNPLRIDIPRSLRGLRLPASVSRLHPWRLNRSWPRTDGDNVGVAEPLSVEPDSYHAALTIFLGLCAIEGTIPPPPWEPRLL